MFKIVAKMYEGVKSRVFTGNIKSEYFASNAGVRQGENLSPLLFSLYINDLEEYLLANGNNFIDFKDEICNSYVKLLVLLYADDTIVLSNTAAGLQKALEDLCNYSASNVSDSQNQKSWTLYKMYCRLANGILMGTLRSESWGVYGGSNLVDIMSGLYDLITLDFFTVIKPRFMENFDVLCKIVLLMCG